jgi:hypothetical protein
MNHGFAMSVKEGAPAPDWDNFDGTSWTVTLRRLGHAYTLFFHQGSAHKESPSIEDVVNCVLLDVAGYLNARSFEDWAAEYGYDTDSRRAQKVYKAVGKQAVGMRQLIGADLDWLLEMFQDY